MSPHHLEFYMLHDRTCPRLLGDPACSFVGGGVLERLPLSTLKMGAKGGLPSPGTVCLLEPLLLLRCNDLSNGGVFQEDALYLGLRQTRPRPE